MNPFFLYIRINYRGRIRLIICSFRLIGLLAALFCCYPVYAQWDTIRYEIDSGGITFSEPLQYTRITFLKPVVFYDDTSKGADFGFADFKDETYFRKVTFEYKADFNKANFRKRADFFDTDFESEAHFSRVGFEGFTYFGYTNFKGETNFSNTVFDSIANFSFVNFFANTDFQNSTFTGKLDFSVAFFGTALNLSYAQFHSEVLLDGAKLPSYLNLYKVKEIAKELDFTYCRLDSTPKCQINLLRSNIEKIRINYELFELAFPKDAKFSDTIQVYERLLDKLKSDGNLVDYELFDIDYRDIVAQKKGGIDLWFSKFQKWWWRYGYSPGRVFQWTVVAFLLLSVINTLFFMLLRERVYEIKAERFAVTKYETPKYWWLHIPSRAWWMVKHFFNGMFYTALVFFGLKLTIENFKRFNVGTVYLLLFNYLPGLICLGYIINIVIVK